jgi:hypothetical protein
MSQTNTTNFILDSAGFQKNIPNATQSTGTLNLTFRIGGSPSSLTLYVSGVSNPATSDSDIGAQPGSETVLGSFSATSGTSTESISLNGNLYGLSRLVTVWENGMNVAVSGSLSTSGGGDVFASENLGAIQTYAAG